VGAGNINCACSIGVSEMTRTAILAIASLVFIAALHFADRIAAGILQCESASTCPVSTEIGGRP
jgi:hypothetical protein